MKAYKIKVSNPELNMEVFHESIYNGRQLMKIVGIRHDTIELMGDYSGGTNEVINKDWIPLNGTFRLFKVCDQVAKYGTCTLHNLHCGSPNCEPALKNWGHYVDGVLVDEVELVERP